MHLLVVEDDEGIAEPLVEGLRREGFEVTWVGTGAEALAAGPVDMVLLDLGLPDMDGYRVCQELRAESAVPIIVVTARGAEVDKVVGLELGADDYLAKPFGIRELVARIRAVHRRIDAPAPNSSERPQQLGDLTIDRRSRRVVVEGDERALTPKEFDLLALLANDPGAVVTRQQILEEVWDPHWYGPTKTVDVHVASLRRKLGHPEWVETVRGVGLRLGPALAGAGASRGRGVRSAGGPPAIGSVGPGAGGPPAIGSVGPGAGGPPAVESVGPGAGGPRVGGSVGPGAGGPPAIGSVGPDAEGTTGGASASTAGSDPGTDGSVDGARPPGERGADP